MYNKAFFSSSSSSTNALMSGNYQAYLKNSFCIRQRGSWAEPWTMAQYTFAVPTRQKKEKPKKKTHIVKRLFQHVVIEIGFWRRKRSSDSGVDRGKSQGRPSSFIY